MQSPFGGNEKVVLVPAIRTDGDRVPLLVASAQVDLGYVLLGLPPSVVKQVNGAAETVDALIDHPLVRAVSFVGSTLVARYVYARGSVNGKRVQAQGGRSTRSSYCRMPTWR